MGGHMSKLLKCSAFLLCALFSGASFAQASAGSYYSCVAQVLKNDTPQASANFIVACGSETLFTHNMKSFDQQTPEQISELKGGFFTLLRGLVNPEGQKCFESETELFWFGICHQ